MKKTKIYFLYPECPKMVRIISEALCLDYTFFPVASVKPLNIKDCVNILKCQHIDKVYLLLDNGQAFLDKSMTRPIIGWIDAKRVEAIQLPFDEKIYRNHT